MYINYNTVNGIEYGTVTRSVRNGAKVKKQEQVYLGRVIDKARGIFKNREKGVFIYDLKSNTFSPVPANFEMPKLHRKTKYIKRKTLVVSFGDVFLLDEYLKKSGFMKAVNAIAYKNPDTLFALLAYYILTPFANCHAKDWWELTYAKYLYPKAQMDSQRISEALADIGSEEAKRHFFREYFCFLKKCVDYTDHTPKGIKDGVLIDSSGLPNAIHFPLTAINNHNGVMSEE